MTSFSRRQWLTGSAGGLLALASGPLLAQAAAPTLNKLRERGTISIAVYHELPPFHDAGKGIEVELAGAIAAELGLKLSLLPFTAGENMGDDLRNMVWRGHYLGFGPADLLLHVPVDRPLMQDNPKVQIFAPYYRERVMIARNLARVPAMESLDAFKGQRIAVPGQSLAGWLLIGADGGAYRNQLTTTPRDGVQAAQMLRSGEVVAAAGHLSELESTLHGDDRFAIDPLPLPRMKDGWAVGCAVKAEATDLAYAVQAAVNKLADSGQLTAIFARGGLRWRPA